MKLKSTSKILTIAVAFVLGSLIGMANPIMPGYDEPCPCSALYPGYYFTGQYFPTKPVLYSYMPYDVLVGYIIMDSIITHAKNSFPNWQSQENFIKSLTSTGDTLNYALKYLYRLADYNPFLYYNFLTSYQEGKQQPMSVLPKLLDQVKKEYGLPTMEIMKAEYILHLKVNAVENFAYESRPAYYDSVMQKTIPADSTKLVYVYAKVLDTIKGQVLPDISNTIEVFVQDSAGTKVKKSRPLNVPPNTNFIYAYNPGWRLKNEKGNKERSMNGGEEVGKEFIVFSFNAGACLNSTMGFQYYLNRPTALGYMGGIFRIRDGDVLDAENDYGWDKYVPVDTFKQNLRTLIDSIKNYGE